MVTSASVTELPLGAAVTPGQDLADVLDSASGTVVRRLGGLGDFSGLQVRGSTTRQVEVFLDGVPLNPDGSDAVDLSELPVSAFDRVELYRGNAPPGFGAAPMGGVVNLVTPGDQAVDARVAGAGGSFGTARLSGVFGPTVGPVDTFFALETFHTEGDYPYFDDQGTEFNTTDDRTPIRENNRIDRQSALGRARLRLGDARLTVLDSLVHQDRGLPGPIQSPAADASFESTRNLLALDATGWLGSAVSLGARGWWLGRQELLHDELAELGTAAKDNTDTSDTLGLQAEIDWVPATWLTTSLLVRGRRDTAQTVDDVQDKTSGEHARLAGTAAIAGTLRLFDERLAISPVVQAEWIGSRPADTGDALSTEDKTDHGADAQIFALPRGGVLVRPWRWLALKANAGMYARAPDFTELYGDRGTFVGNTDLVPEHGVAFDVGLRAEGAPTRWLRGSLDLSYGHNYTSDLIVWVQNSQFTTRPENLADVFVQSAEGALSFDVGGVLRSTTNVTYLVSRNLASDPVYANKRIPGLPDLETSQATTLSWKDRVSLTHTWSFTGATFVDTPNYVSTAPRDLHSLALSVTPIAGLPTIEAEVLNLFDVRGMAVDRDVLSDEDNERVVKPLADFSGYPLPGRTVMISVSWVQPAPRRTPG